MIIKSIRWRLQLWLGFLLICVLSGFGVAVYQLQRINQLNQIDEELQRRLAALDSAVRGGPPPDFGRGHPPFEPEFRRRTRDVPDSGAVPRARTETPGEERGRANFGIGLRPQAEPEAGSAPPEPGVFPDFEDGPKRGRPPYGRSVFPPPGPGTEMHFRPREFRVSLEVSNLFEDTGTNAFYFVVWSRDRTLLNSSTNAPGDVPLPERRPGNTLTHTRMRATLREAFHYTELGDCVLAGRNIMADLSALRRFSLWLLAAGGTVLAFGLGGGWWLTTRAIRPVEEISAAASRISAGNLSERINGAETDNELGRLAAVLNSTFARLEAAFAQQKQFTADASHELRTPLAVLISEAQTALARERSAAEYRETVEACLDTAQQMRRLTESLLELARLEAGHEQCHRARLDLAEQTRVCVERLRSLAAERELRIHCDLAPVEAFSDAERLERVISNLLINAIHYNKPNGEVRVATRAENGAALLTIADTGQGIPPEQLPHIFERFYRADESRSRADGHFGLGLAICKAIVEADGGSIEASSQLDIGTTFIVRLPLAQDA